MNILSLYYRLAIAFGAISLSSSVTLAAALGPEAAPARAETWTGFSAGLGGGIGILSADSSSKASRRDTIGICETDGDNCNGLSIDLLNIDQNYTSNLGDLSDTGGFFTVQGAYDYQFAPRWVVGGFVDADWSDIKAESTQASTASLTLLPNGVPDGVFDLNRDGQQIINFLTGFNIPLANTKIETKISTDWSISVGGRLGWLASPSTLLYVLGAYTHQELGDAQVKVTMADPLQVVSDLGFVDISSPTSLLVKLPDSLDGFSLGGGGEVKIGGPWTLKLEYRWTHLQGSSDRASSKDGQFINVDDELGVFRNVNSNASADLDLDIQTVRGAVSYHFWSGGGGGYGG
jgi:outer membrane immunogenic protein